MMVFKRESEILVWRVVAVFILTYVTVSNNACSELKSSDSYSAASSEALSREAFKTSLYPVLRENCAQCHGKFQNPMFAQEDADTAFDVILKNELVEFSNPDSSYFLTKLATGHNSFPIETINSVRSQIEAWVAAVGSDGDPDAGTVEFETASAFSVLRKIKNVVHGGALTDQEWQENYRSIDNKEKLKSLVDKWMNTDEGELKMKFYLQTALNQDVKNARDLFRTNIDRPIYTSLRESFSRTALDLIKRDRPFSEIATTNRFAVNTVLLTAYAYQDRRDEVRNSDNNPIRINGFLRANANDDDYSDWRFVRFVQSDDEGPLFTDIEHWRGVANNSTVRFGIPRVGYFSTLAFQGQYPTNDDNKFRSTINQTLIAGLSKTFSPSDNTEQPMLVHLDAEHAPKTSQCFGCHRLMDPMKNIFKNKMDFNYRFNPRYSNETSSFAVYNYTKELNELSDLGAAIASHPDFHTAWTQKMCVALNTSKCLETDPEFLRVANAFKSSGFKFRVLYRELSTSPLVTGSERVLTNKTNGFVIARTRTSHFCNNMKARIKQIQSSRGVVEDDVKTVDYCDRVASQVENLGDDYTVRGITDVINSFPVDTFFRQGLEQACFAFADRVIRRRGEVLEYTGGGLSADLDLITQYLMGIPVSHPRYDLVRSAVEEVYDYSRTDQGISHTQSLRQVITFACTSPDFTGVGL